MTADLETLERDDDTGRLSRMLEPPSDPGRELTALRLALDAHGRDDRRAIRIGLFVGSTVASVMIAAAGSMLSVAWEWRETQGRDRERIEQLVRDVGRLDETIDRLDERLRHARGEE